MRTLVLSDLRFGCGADSGAIMGLHALLGGLLAPALGPLRVVLNGDFLDFPGQRSGSLGTPVAIAHAILADPGCATVIASLRELLARGGELLVRPGEHDGELRDPTVHESLAAALSGDAGDRGRVRVLEAAPYVLDVGGVRVAICRRPPATDPETIRWIAARVLAPLRTHYGLGLAGFLRPDYTAAVLAAIAVNPASVKLALEGQVGVGVWLDLFDGGGMSPLDLPRELVSAGLDEREREVLLRLLDPAVAMGDIDDVRSLERARLKLFRSALARLPSTTFVPRNIAGEEWRALRAIARRCRAALLISASASRCGWRSEPRLTAIDTGTWTWQALRPDGDEPARWRGELEAWQWAAVSPPTLGAAAPLHRHLTAALVEPSATAPGIRVALIEWRPESGIVVLRERKVVA